MDSIPALSSKCAFLLPAPIAWFHVGMRINMFLHQPQVTRFCSAGTDFALESGDNTALLLPSHHHHPTHFSGVLRVRGEHRLHPRDHTVLEVYRMYGALPYSPCPMPNSRCPMPNAPCHIYPAQLTMPPVQFSSPCHTRPAQLTLTLPNAPCHVPPAAACSSALLHHPGPHPASHADCSPICPSLR